MVRRLQLLAPVAASVRRSLAVSLRIRPMLMPRMPRASAIPNTVAQVMISDEDGALDLVSMIRPALAAASRALLICAAVGGCGVVTSQPAGLALRWNWWTARSVITVFGADVPAGSALTSWITGLGRQLVFGHGKLLPLGPPGALGLPGLPGGGP